MDPITAAIIAAATAGLAKVSEGAIVDAYQALKSALKRKFGEKSKLNQAVQEVEAEPDFKPNHEALAGRVAQQKAAEDPELVRLATLLIDRLNDQAGKGRSSVVKIQGGDYSINIGGDNQGTINYTGGK